jgi:TonB family protein
MRRSWGIAVMVACCGHAGALVGMGRVGFATPEPERRETALIECVVEVEGMCGEVVAEPVHAAEVAGGDARAEVISSLTSRIGEMMRGVGEGVEVRWESGREMSAAVLERVDGAREALSAAMERGRAAAARARAAAEVRRTEMADRAARLAAERRVALESAERETEAAARAWEAVAGNARGAESAGAPADHAREPGGVASAGEGASAREGSDGTGQAPGVGAVGIGPAPAVGNRAPAYPAEALRRGVEGVVVVRVEVDALGSVSGARVVESAGDGSLDASALEAVRSWRFEPGRDGSGRLAASRADVPVVFRIRRER